MQNGGGGRVQPSAGCVGGTGPSVAGDETLGAAAGIVEASAASLVGLGAAAGAAVALMRGGTDEAGATNDARAGDAAADAAAPADAAAGGAGGAG
eukprot:5441634-Pleurochrysis_carterae.AAC.1